MVLDSKLTTIAILLEWFAKIFFELDEKLLRGRRSLFST